MPSSTDKQRRFFGAELARRRAGKKTKTNVSTRVLEEFAGSVDPGFFNHMDASTIERTSITGGQNASTSR